MDEIDIAQERQAEDLRRLLAAQAYALPKGEAARDCLDCGEAIPEERRSAMPGCRFCRPCQEALERHQRGRR